MNPYQGINIYKGPEPREGFHRFGNYYGNLINREHFMGRDVFEYKNTAPFHPPVNVKHDHQYYDVEIALAGYKKENLKISVKDRILTIEGFKSQDKEEKGNYLRREFQPVSFRRDLKLEDYIDLDRIEAKYERGILTVRLFEKAGIRRGHGRKIFIK